MTNEKKGQFHRLFAKTHRLYAKHAFGSLAHIGITHGQPRILTYLSEHDGCMQKDIADTFELEPATVTETLSVMQKNGLVRRTQDEEDRRVWRVWCTEKGVQAKARCDEVFDAVEQRCFQGFSADERSLCSSFFERMYDNLKQDGR